MEHYKALHKTTIGRLLGGEELVRTDEQFHDVKVFPATFRYLQAFQYHNSYTIS